MRRTLLIGILLLFLIPYSYAVCEDYNTPNIFLGEIYELSEGERFYIDIYSTVIEKRTSYAFTSINSSFKNFNIKKNGIIDLIPEDEDVGTHKILIVGYADNDCIDSKLATFKVYDRPDLKVRPKQGVIKTKEGRGIVFEAEASDKDKEELRFEWRLNGESKSTNKSFKYLPGYGESGYKNLKVIVTDERNLTAEASWNLTIDNVNRPPFLFKDLPNTLMFTERTLNAYNLNDYFIDPDYNEIKFSYEEVVLEYHTLVIPADLQIELNEGVVIFTSNNKTGNKLLRFIAEDEFGLKAKSNQAMVTAIEEIKSISSDYCGDDFCSEIENCIKCPSDCGNCDPVCEPAWVCDDWGECKPTGIQTRLCTDENLCGTNRNKPIGARECKYTATCFDKVKNQREEKVDCGGPCGPCPTCEDGIKNQGEENIDCGGPCKSCDSCEDNLQNQDESDVDCGGICGECAPGMMCRTNFDCSSYICAQGYCSHPTCTDNVRNQDEKGKDCGGPCEPCSTCEDNIQNQGEENIDCGGPCEPCATCNDKVKNQDEKLIDCGGRCRNCILMDYVNYLEFKKFFLVLTGIILIVIIILKQLSKSTYGYNRGLLSRLESEEHLGNVIFLNNLLRIFRILKIRKSGNSLEALERLEKEDHNSETITNIISSYFHGTLGVDEGSNYDQTYEAIGSSRYPGLVKVMLVILLQKVWLLKSGSASLPQEVSNIRKSIIRILNELKKDI